MLLGLLLLLATHGGCSSLRTTDPARTATEQFLMTYAAIEAVEALSFDVLRGRKVYIDDTYFASPEKPFILGEFRAKALRSGLRIVPEAELAQVIIEVRSGGVGIDRSDFLLGVPQLAVTGEAFTSEIPILTPELAIVKNLDQQGFASVAYVAYWRASGEFVAGSGSLVGRTRREDWWFFGYGPNTVGDIPSAREEDVP